MPSGTEGEGQTSVWMKGTTPPWEMMTWLRSLLSSLSLWMVSWRWHGTMCLLLVVVHGITGKFEDFDSKVDLGQ